jgi:hypothetical protein
LGAIVDPQGVEVNGIEIETLDKLYIGEVMKLTTSGTVSYGTIYSIDTSDESFIISLDPVPKVPPDSIEILLSFHYGHYKEIVNTFHEMTKNKDFKREKFPAICLFLDILERISWDGFEREASLHIVLLTDTDPLFNASQRKQYSFDPLLTPLYEKFIEILANSRYINELLPDHDKIDRYFWGREGLYGSEANIFNDYIDAIEIKDLTIKTYKTC